MATVEVSLPEPLDTVNKAVWVPGFAYTTTGLRSLETEGVPPGNDQLHAAGLPVEASVKATVLPAQRVVREGEKLAVGNAVAGEQLVLRMDPPLPTA